MTNKKFKLAAMSLALTACVAASPLAANAESADAEVNKPASTAAAEVPGENTPTTNETKPGSNSGESKPGSNSGESKPQAAVEHNDLAVAPAPVLMLAKAPAAPTGAPTTPAEDKTVATINGKGYTSFDAAVNEANDNDIIEVVEDVETDGMFIKNKKLTIQGVTKPTTKTNEDGTEEKKPKLTFKKKGIALWGTDLTFKDMQVEMDGINSTPYTAEWDWMTIGANNNSVLELDNTDLTMDNFNDKTAHPDKKFNGQFAIYFTGENKLNVKEGSTLTIKNYNMNALTWDGGSGYNLNIEDSTVNLDGNGSGIAGTFQITVDNNSTLNVTNNRGNGSNGSHYDIKNGSNVNFSGNGSHGLSAGNLSVKDSTVTAENNGMTGIIFTGKGEISDHSTVTITGTKGTSYWNAGLRLKTKNASLKIKDSTVTIKDNAVTGIFCDSGSQLTIEDTANVTVTNNNAAQENYNKRKDLARKGGGLVVRGGASAKLGANTTINNNSAALEGADIFIEAGGTLTFSVGNAGIGDILDKGPDGTDCGHKIDGWYIDANGARWDFDTDADSAQAFLGSLDELPNGVTVNYDQATGLYTIAVDKTAGNGFALKAAHAELPAPTPDPDGPDTPTPNPTPKPEPKPGPDTSITPEDPQLPPVQDARADTPDSPVLPSSPANPAVQDAHALPQTGTSLFAALAMALSGFALTIAGAWASLLGKNSRH